MPYYSAFTNKYAYLWNKYRPVILRLMIDSAEGPQEYKFSNHEFEKVTPTKKGSYAFILRVFQGDAVNDIKTSDVAKDLLMILRQSKTASELMESCTYEFMLDRHFLLHIKQECE